MRSDGSYLLYSRPPWLTGRYHPRRTLQASPDEPGSWAGASAHPQLAGAGSEAGPIASMAQGC
jgi:hypothetical protein